jgi:hypothetical protein
VCRFSSAVAQYSSLIPLFGMISGLLTPELLAQLDKEREKGLRCR